MLAGRFDPPAVNLQPQDDGLTDECGSSWFYERRLNAG